MSHRTQRYPLLVAQLDAWRTGLGLSHRGFARDTLGVSPATWSRILSGERGPTTEQARRWIRSRPQLQPFWFADLSAA